MSVLSLPLLVFLSAAPVAPAPVVDTAVPRYPVVLVHGWMGYGSLGAVGHYFLDAAEILREAGFEVFEPPLSPLGPPEVRGPKLLKAIDSVLYRTGAAKVHLIGHSQGGLDSRYVVSALGAADRVASIVTLSTPHHGTPWGDADDVLPALLLQALFHPLADQMVRTQRLSDVTISINDSLSAMRPSAMAKFNARYPTTLGVPLFSFGATSGGPVDAWACADAPLPVPTLHDATHVFVGGGIFVLPLTSSRGMPNDGVIPTQSARFGTFMGCYAADHVDWLGWGPDLVWPGRLGSFDHQGFYRVLAQALRGVEREGEAGFMAQVPGFAALTPAG